MTFMIDTYFINLQFKANDPVTLWVNKVGPYNNPQETYNYYSLPFCHPSKNGGAHKWGGLGEVLGGNELIDSQIDIKFKSNSSFLVLIPYSFHFLPFWVKFVTDFFCRGRRQDCNL